MTTQYFPISITGDDTSGYETTFTYLQGVLPSRNPQRDVNSVTLTPKYYGFRLDWVNNLYADYQATRIIRWDDDLSFQDGPLEPYKGYTYGLFTHDSSGYYSNGIYIRGIVHSYEIPPGFSFSSDSNQISLNWSTYIGFSGVFVSHKAGSLPSSQFDNDWQSFTSASGVVDSTYNHHQMNYYSLYNYDGNYCFSPFVRYAFNPEVSIPGPISFWNKNGYTWVQMGWTMPATNQSWAGVQLVRRFDREPTGPFDGDIIYSGSNMTYTDTNVYIGRPVYYALYSYDSITTFGSGIHWLAIPDCYQNPKNISYYSSINSMSLSWINPTWWFAKTMVIRRSDRYAAFPGDGTIVYWDSGNAYTDTGLTADSTYFYTIFSHDENYNFSPGIYISRPAYPVDFYSTANKISTQLTSNNNYYQQEFELKTHQIPQPSLCEQFNRYGNFKFSINTAAWETGTASISLQWSEPGLISLPMGINYLSSKFRFISNPDNNGYYLQIKGHGLKNLTSYFFPQNMDDPKPILPLNSQILNNSDGDEVYSCYFFINPTYSRLIIQINNNSDSIKIKDIHLEALPPGQKT
jgi:hypothetical protein